MVAKPKRIMKTFHLMQQTKSTSTISINALREQARKRLAIALASAMEKGKSYSTSELKELFSKNSLVNRFHEEYCKLCPVYAIYEYSDRWEHFLQLMERIGYIKLENILSKSGKISYFKITRL
jgi:hypothetical protein